LGQKTPLYQWHANRKARIVDFAGWDMPVIYTSINDEHRATRTSVGLFDISHMGRIIVEGPGAQGWLDRVLTNRVDNLKPNQVRYSLVLNEAGGTLDDILVTRLPDSRYLVVVNASNRVKLLDWFGKSAPADVKITDRTLDWAMIACQGPGAVSAMQKLVDVSIADMKYYFSADATIDGIPGFVSRTGYTGEDGGELILPSKSAEAVWSKLIDAGATPVGLGARDTLRLEAGMPLYEHELTEEIDPIQAGLGWAVKSSEKDFIGRASLLTKDPGRPIRVGIRLNDKRIAREGFPIRRDGVECGRVTSGTFSPTLEASIAMAFVKPDAAKIGTELEVDVRGTAIAAEVVPLPFYSRKK
jgi:aminomethyltransferase